MNYIDLVKEWEALRLEAYMPTPEDKWTIGWGHTKGVKKGDRVSREHAEKLLQGDLAWAVGAVDELVHVPLKGYQRDALISFVFNIGRPQFENSTMLRKLNIGDYEGAAQEFPRWNKQKGKTLKGLVRRRAQEMEIFLGHIGDITPTPAVDEVPPLKPLTLSKEIAAGVSSLFVAAGTFLAQLNDTAQNISVGVLAVALAVIGAFIIVNRLNARRKAER